uniref:Uncharacterized protein n=1 Tax=Cajanus cajan TaxID=3821 RepID=A0A151TLI5_CAJCA|nr:hypothetical protein KK1_021529 [Cajanus cajan]
MFAKSVSDVDCNDNNSVSITDTASSKDTCNEYPWFSLAYPICIFSDMSADDSNALSIDSDSNALSIDSTQHDYSHALFGPVPSETEIENALSFLQQLYWSSPLVTYNPSVDQVPSDGLETDWTEPPLSLYNSRVLQDDEFERNNFAIHILQSDACAQRMVKSLSSDKSVWDAVQNNELVRKLKKTISGESDGSSNGMVNNDSPDTKNIIMRMSDAVKAKLMEAIEKITRIVKKLFKSEHHCKTSCEGKSNSFKDKLRVSVMFSMMIFLTVVLNRIYYSNTQCL